MDTAVMVAIIGGAVTVIGFVVSGVFGLINATGQRESAAAAGVERALNERIAFKDEQLEDCRADRDKAEAAHAEAMQTIQERDLAILQLQGEKHELEVELRMCRNDYDHLR